MDYPLDWRQMLTIIFSIDKILKFSRILILEFSDSRTQILVVFCPEKQSVRRREQNIFQMTALVILVSVTLLLLLCQNYFLCNAEDIEDHQNFY